MSVYDKNEFWVEDMSFMNEERFSDDDDDVIEESFSADDGESHFGSDDEYFGFEDDVDTEGFDTDNEFDFEDNAYDVEEEQEYEGDEEESVFEEEVDLLDDSDCYIPGTDVVYVEDGEDETPEPEVKETTWESDGDHAKFIGYLEDKVRSVPKHSGNTVPGCERARAYLKSLESEIHKAMRTDLQGKIDEQKIEGLRNRLDNMIERLDNQIARLRGPKKRSSLNVKLISNGACEKCGSTAPMWDDVDGDRQVCLHCEAELVGGDRLEKTAGTPIMNVYVTAFERAIVGTIINSTVSGGRNIEETYDKLNKKYGFDKREELAIRQLVSDYGYPILTDRGRIGENDGQDPTSGDGVDFLTNYYA